jgi:hypothetical protein
LPTVPPAKLIVRPSSVIAVFAAVKAAKSFSRPPLTLMIASPTAPFCETAPNVPVTRPSLIVTVVTSAA